MSESQAKVRESRRVSPIWAVPIVALLLGLWMVVYTIQTQGPLVTIVFSTAEGIVAGETKLKLRSVDVGLVESVVLGDDLESVVVTARLEREAEPLLREDTEFWVVRARFGAGGVSGLGTLLSGAYIQIAPGLGAEGRRSFAGLEEPPVTPAGTPGLRLVLVSDRAGSISSGEPILYKGYTVGRVESAQFDVVNDRMRFGAFIDAPFDDLVTNTTRFWDASGLTVDLSADGLEAQMASLETLVLGGVEMGLPLGVRPGSPSEDGDVFRLYESFAQVNETPHRYSLEYVASFPQSIRGLNEGAPVEYRGIPVGRVERVMIDEYAGGEGLRGETDPVPVLLRLEPGRLRQPDSPEGVERLKRAVETAIQGGMRASLATGNLITGQLYVSLGIFPNEPLAEIGEFEGRPTIPTIETGLEGLQVKVASLLDKLNALPLEGAVGEAEQSLAGLRRLLNDESTQQLPSSLDATLAGVQATLASVSADSELQQGLLTALLELDRTLVSLRQLLDTLERQPNALVFDSDYGADPEPPPGSP